MTRNVIKPIWKCIVKRSCRIARLDDELGSYLDSVIVRAKVLNPLTGRMVYADTKQHVQRQLKSDGLDKTIKLPPRIIRRKSNRLINLERLRQLKSDGLDKTIKLPPRKPKKAIKRRIQLDDTICNWDATIDIYYLIENDRIKKKYD